VHKDVTARILFIVLLLVVGWTALRVVAPFVAGFTWAAVLVATFRPFHRRLESAFRGRHWAATLVVTTLVALFVVVPVVLVAFQAAQAGVAAFQWIQASYESGGASLGIAERWPWLADAVVRAKALVGLANVDLRAAAVTGLQRLATFVAAAGPSLVGGAFGLAFSFVVMLVGLPLFFANADAITRTAAGILPIPDADAERIIEDLGAMTRSVFVSVGLTAAAQAALGGLALGVLGVPHAIPFTAAMFFLALLPGGTALVWLPAAVWLAVNGHATQAIVLVAWGGGVVSTIDNVLRPFMVGSGVKLPGATLFLGMFGGMAAFGLVGLFLGPISLYILQELLAILRRDIYGQEGRGEYL
jgi:predicted PurR-regulated permease PerM